MKFARSFLGALVVALPLVSLTGQGLRVPSINPNEPVVLGRNSTKVAERIDTRKWRKEYNVHELAVLIWQLYRSAKEGGDWKDIFGSLTGLLDEEKQQHEAYYSGMKNASAMAAGYHLIADIRDEFSQIIRYGKAISESLQDPNAWQDRERTEYILAISLEIKSRAFRTLRYLPVIAGLDVSTMPEFGEPDMEVADEKYWATSTDRLQHMDRMYTELTELKSAIQDLYYHTKAIRSEYQRQANDQSAGRSLLGIN